MNVIDPVSAVLRLKGDTVWSISPDATVYEAIQLMSEKNIGALVVMQDGRPAGIISERDYTRKVALLGKVSRQTPVREIMSTSLVTVTPQHTVADCMRLMNDHRVRHLPVLDGDKLAGLVSIGNLVNWIISAQTAQIHQMQNYLSGNYHA